MYSFVADRRAISEEWRNIQRSQAGSDRPHAAKNDENMISLLPWSEV